MRVLDHLFRNKHWYAGGYTSLLAAAQWEVHIMVWTWIKKQLVKILFVSVGGLKPIIAGVIRKEQEKVGKIDPDAIAEAIVKEIEQVLFKSLPGPVDGPPPTSPAPQAPS